MIADGGEAIADIEVLRHQAPVLGAVASQATVWWALDEISTGQVKKIAAARASTRRHVWALLAESDSGSRPRKSPAPISARSSCSTSTPRS